MNNEQMSEPPKIKFENILTCGFEEEVENINFDQKYSAKIENLRF